MSDLLYKQMYTKVRPMGFEPTTTGLGNQRSTVGATISYLPSLISIPLSALCFLIIPGYNVSFAAVNIN